MTNILPFQQKPIKAEPDRFPNYDLPPGSQFEEIRTLYGSERWRLSLAVEGGDGPTPLYLILHEGHGRNARCLYVWSPLEWHEVGNDVPVIHGLAVARALEHVELNGLLTADREPHSKTPVADRPSIRTGARDCIRWLMRSCRQ